MIQGETINTLEQFESLKEGDLVVCEFHRDTYKGNNRTRFAAYEIHENKASCNEIILQKKNNVYFNYFMFLAPEKHGSSNLKSLTRITQKE
ncbi:hypothetical protein SAMN04489761_3035 [Tenacibaculum sp. MAR_2009_124]|uniref:hypothetical protein n=1 Tax=Tenacibaculum sp. MAR_2009_124 TaxID=1250059 RepID=UPI000898F11C|nr:hypothetical protein [Tenacibaculum sp. MAR_2009_124]SEC45345.1 hypothetical protein SAMN04489761_3035 [Tenacibaculum sp. MAR_2009_124]